MTRSVSSGRLRDTHRHRWSRLRVATVGQQRMRSLTQPSVATPSRELHERGCRLWDQDGKAGGFVPHVMVRLGALRLDLAVREPWRAWADSGPFASRKDVTFRGVVRLR